MPRGIYPRISIEERFATKVNKLDSGCWEWIGGLNSSLLGKGYGLFWNGQRKVTAHHFAYEMTNGVIPEGLEIDHLCRNRACVNPNHLEVVTHKENVKRGLSPLFARQRMLAKTHCPQGHPYDEQNTIFYRGSRYCGFCHRIGNRERMRKKRELNLIIAEWML